MFLILLSGACSSNKTNNSSDSKFDLNSDLNFDEKINKKLCDQAANAIPVEREEMSYFSEVKQGWGEVASISVSIISSAGMFVAGAIGGPASAVRLAKKSGEQVRKKTKSWSCPLIDPFSVKVRQVASCYSSKNDIENLRKSRNVLSNFNKDKEFWSCISNTEKESFVLDINKTRSRLKETGSIHLLNLAKAGDNNGIRELIKQDEADINTTDVLGNTSLHYAFLNKLESTFEILVNLGANFEIKNLKGESVYTLANIEASQNRNNFYFAKLKLKKLEKNN